MRIRTMLLLASLVLAGSPGHGQQLIRSEDAIVALFSLQTELQVDVKMLGRLEVKLGENERLWLEARDRVERVHTELDALFAQYQAAVRARDSGRGDQDGEGTDPSGRVEALEQEIDDKELELANADSAQIGVHEEGRRLRSDIRNLHERMRLLAQQIDALQTNLPREVESVTGVWDIAFLPSGDRGVFALFQSGTIVTGQYLMDGPFRGSLEGTLIDRRLLLHRIDSRLGRSMDLTALLSPDGQALRGTWENYDLANGQAPSGSWSARRRQPAPQEDGAEGGP